jgi:hypothetical protein
MWKAFQGQKERVEFRVDAMNFGNCHLEEVKEAVVQNEGADSNFVGSGQYIVNIGLNLVGDIARIVDVGRIYAERRLWSRSTASSVVESLK